MYDHRVDNYLLEKLKVLLEDGGERFANFVHLRLKNNAMNQGKVININLGGKH